MTDRAEPQQPSLFHRMGGALQHLVGCADCATYPWTRCQNGGQDALAALHEYEEFAASPAPDPAQEAAPVAVYNVPEVLMRRIWNTVDYYANTHSYRGERTGGVLAGCPRAPDPTPHQMTEEARKLMALLEEFVRPQDIEASELDDVCTRYDPRASIAEVQRKDAADDAREAMVKHMVNRFLGWRLPKPWHPDNGVSYKPLNYAHQLADHDWPVGTNLFSATEAEAMVRYMLDGYAAPVANGTEGQHRERERLRAIQHHCDNVFGLRAIECESGFRVEYDNVKCRTILKAEIFSMVESINKRACPGCEGSGLQEEDACTFCWGQGTTTELAPTNTPASAAAEPHGEPMSDGQIAYERAFPDKTNRVPFKLLPDWMEHQWHRQAEREKDAPPPIARSAADQAIASSKCPMDGIDTPHAHDQDKVIDWLRIQARQFAPEDWKNIAITRIDPMVYGYAVSSTWPNHRTVICGSYEEAVNYRMNKIPLGYATQIHKLYTEEPAPASVGSQRSGSGEATVSKELEIAARYVRELPCTCSDEVPDDIDADEYVAAVCTRCQVMGRIDRALAAQKSPAASGVGAE